MSPRLHSAVGLCCLVAAACSSDPAASDSSQGGTGGTAATSTGGAGKAGATTKSCPRGDNPRSAVEPTALGLVSGSIVDEQGEPTRAGLVQVCGTDICRNADVGEDGTFADRVEGPINVPACKFGDGLSWAKLAVPLVEGDNELGTLVTVRLPDYADGVPLVPGETATSDGVSLTLADDAHVVPNILDYETEAERALRAVELPEAARAQLGEDFVTAFALSPLETRICPNPSLQIENRAGLDAGTELELYLLGLDAEERFVPYARWAKVADGRVSDDGATLEFPDGVPLLTAIGVKVKP